MVLTSEPEADLYEVNTDDQLALLTATAVLRPESCVSLNELLTNPVELDHTRC